jgi:hypothetical protein
MPCWFPTHPTPQKRIDRSCSNLSEESDSIGCQCGCSGLSLPRRPSMPMDFEYRLSEKAKPLDHFEMSFCCETTDLHSITPSYRYRWTCCSVLVLLYPYIRFCALAGLIFIFCHATYHQHLHHRTYYTHRQTQLQWANLQDDHILRQMPDISKWY